MIRRSLTLFAFLLAALWGPLVLPAAAQAPDAPTGLSATAGDAQVSLAWNGSYGAAYYEVYRSTTPGGPYAYVGSEYATSYTDYGDWIDDGFGGGYLEPLQNGVTYYYVVVASNSFFDTSGYSNEASATPVAPPPPPAPTGLSATAGATQVSLSWSASVGANSYNIKRSVTSGGPYTTIANTGGTTYSNTGLIGGTTYYYVVSAVNRGGESPDSSQVSATPTGPPPPAAPTGLTAAPGSGKNQIALKWSQSGSAGVTQNRIYRSTSSGSPYSLVITVAANTSYTDKSLRSGTTYYYVVTSVNSSGKESAYSNQASARPR